MMVDHFIAFDDWLVTGKDVFTSDLHANRLASGDSLAIFAIADDEGGSPGEPSVMVEHGGDGYYYASKNGAPEIEDSLIPFGKAVLFGYDDGQRPTASHARLRISCTGTAELVRVRVYVTIRDVDLDMVPDLPPPRAAAPTPAHAPVDHDRAWRRWFRKRLEHLLSGQGKDDGDKKKDA